MKFVQMLQPTSLRLVKVRNVAENLSAAGSRFYTHFAQKVADRPSNDCL